MNVGWSIICGLTGIWEAGGQICLPSTYKIILTDSNNCHADSTVTLTEPDPIEIAFDKIDRSVPST
jgi:hypothetical protein